jgi:hypothetical protein
MITEHLKRFILTSIDSVPHLEAILLLRYDLQKSWDAKVIAQTLYISEKKACDVLDDLCASRLIVKEVDTYHYNPSSPDIKKTLDELADIYAKNLIEVTHLIHAKTDRQAQQFGDAFKWLNGKDQ